jgi:hypothetical protein
MEEMVSVKFQVESLLYFRHVVEKLASGEK